MLLGWQAWEDGKTWNPVPVDDITRATGGTLNGLMSFRHLIQAARHYGLELEYKQLAMWDVVEDEIDAKRPVIVLIHYGSIPNRQNKKFTGGHFVVVVGYDDKYVYVNDPDWRGTRRLEGYNLRIPRDMFELAHGRNSALTGNLPYQALFVKRKDPVVFQSPVSFNAHLRNIRNYSEFLRRAQVLNPTVLLAYVDQPQNPVNSPFQELQLKLPNTKIVARAFHAGDFKFHQWGTDEGWQMSPGKFLQTYGWMGTSGRTLQVMNEPSGYEEIERLVQWMCQVIRMATSLNISLTVLNFGVGHPRDVLVGDKPQWDSRFDDVLIALSETRDRHCLGLHEYLPDWDGPNRPTSETAAFPD